MTGTAQEVEPEIKRVYDLSMTRIPTHKPSRRQRWPDQVFAGDEARWQAVAQRAAELAGQGRAVLIGSRSVAASETLDALLTARGVTHRVLNARQDETEAESVALAGQPGAITVATNMAGRGTDIKLAKEVEAKGGLHVILTEFHESGRVDRQLFGRSARQGDPGSVEAMVCWRDEVFVRFAPWVSLLARRLMGRRTRAGAAFKWLVAYAQWKSEREGRRERLSVRHSISTATPLGPYPSYMMVCQSAPPASAPDPRFTARSMLSSGTEFLRAF